MSSTVALPLPDIFSARDTEAYGSRSRKTMHVWEVALYKAHRINFNDQVSAVKLHEINKCIKHKKITSSLSLSFRCTWASILIVVRITFSSLLFNGQTDDWPTKKSLSRKSSLQNSGLEWGCEVLRTVLVVYRFQWKCLFRLLYKKTGVAVSDLSFHCSLPPQDTDSL